MKDNSWVYEVREWISKRREATPEMPEQFVQFFQIVFANTQNPQQAWFGSPTHALSLVIGHIYLAAVNSSGKDKGIWLLVDREFPDIEGLEHGSAKSTEGSPTPLFWVHAKSLATVGRLIKATELWKSYAQASEKIFNSSVAHERGDKYQIDHGRRRLQDFWSSGNPNS
jgi:hypothetical protein